MISKAITSFATGEVSPWLDGRIDLEKYGSACRVCENWLITPYGGVRRRPGTRFVGALRDETEVGRLLPFRFSTTDTYMLVLNDGYIDVYGGGSTPALIDSLDVATETGSNAYAAADLAKIQYAQQNDVMYLVHPDYPVRKLIRTSSTTFTIEDVDWSWAPVQDQNLDEAVTVAASAVTGTGITLTGVGTTWTSDLIGSRMRIAHDRADDEYNASVLAIAGTVQSSEIIVQGAWQAECLSGGTTNATFKVQRWDGAAWEDIRTYDHNGQSASFSGTEDELVRMRIELVSGGAGSCIGELRCDEEPFGEVEITAVAGATSATADVKKYLYSTDATSLWSEGAFSEDAGYARTASFHEGRLVFGGTAKAAQTIWGSVSDDYENFRTGTNDDDSYRHTLAAQEHNGIRWMVSERRLLIGTSGGEFVVGSADDSVVVTPTNVRARRHSNFGSDEIQAVFVNDSVIYAQRHGRKIREYGYSFERDRYQASDLTILAEHITGTGILEFAYQQQREATLWAVTEEGDLIGLTYEREQAVVGWHRHTTGASDNFESVETIYGEGEEDEVWVIVQRTVDGMSQRYLERLDPGQYQTAESEDKDNYWYVDCGLRVTGSGLTSITLAHLPDTEVWILADGVQVGPVYTDPAGVAVLPDSGTADTITAGLQMISRLEPMKLDVSLGNGTARGREGRINRLFISVWRSMAGKFGQTAQGDISTLDLDPIQYRNTNDTLDTSPAVKTGEFELDCDFDYDEDGVTIGIVNDSVYPQGILLLVPKLDFYGDNA